MPIVYLRGRKEKNMKEAMLSWSKPTESWVIRLWSESKQEWIEDSSYPVKDVNPEMEIGWVSELLLTRMYELEGMGYKVALM